MHLPNLVLKSHPAVYGAILVTLLVLLYYFSWQYHAAYPWFSPSYHSTRPLSEDFISDWLDVHLVEPFNPSAINAYCNTTEWRPNIVFRFNNVNGSIGDVRGNVLDFLFFAIEAGASIILPDVANIDQEDLSNVGDAVATFGNLFDEEWFLHAISEACPQMAIYRPSDAATLPEALVGSYAPRSLRIDILPGNSRKAYREHLNSWLKVQTTYSPNEVTLVNIEVFSSLWEIETRSLPSSFRRNFPQLLRIEPSLRRLAALIAQGIAARPQLKVLDPRDEIPAVSFYGVYLDIPVDQPKEKSPNTANANFSAQTDAYIAHAFSHNLPLLYAASSNASILALFRDKAAQHAPPLSVTMKTDLLPSSALKELKGLTWHQAALVDYEVLRRSSIFGGWVNSSLALSVAFTRAQRREDEARVGDPWRARHLEEGLFFDDGISRIISRDKWREERVPRGLWP